jgi:DNA repair photolyase
MVEAERRAIRLIAKKGSTLHDYPYSGPKRKCPHFWVINVTPPGHCIHHCLYCYAQHAIYSQHSKEIFIYNNLAELVERDLKRITLCPPVSMSNTSDPCQPIAELRNEVRRLVQLLMDYGISFSITTKGDPGFLLKIPGFISYKHKFIAITIEGTADVISMLSPLALPFERRVEVVCQLSSLGIQTLIRLDPLFIHLFQALYGDSWFDKLEDLIDIFASTGAPHIVCSTGRLSKKSSEGDSLWQKMLKVIQAQSAAAARCFEQEYRYKQGGTSQGYLLRKDLRLQFHHKLKALVESKGMTYSTCQELGAEESDSSGLAHCQRFVLPFAKKQSDGRFKAID